MYDQFVFAVHDWDSYNFLPWFASTQLHKISYLFSNRPHLPAPSHEKVTTNCKENAPGSPQPENLDFQTFWSHTKEMEDVKWTALHIDSANKEKGKKKQQLGMVGKIIQTKFQVWR